MKIVIKSENGLFYCGDCRWSNLESQAKVFGSFRDLPGHIQSNNRDLELRVNFMDPMSAEYVTSFYGYLTPSCAPVEVTGVWMI